VAITNLFYSVLDVYGRLAHPCHTLNFHPLSPINRRKFTCIDISMTSTLTPKIVNSGATPAEEKRRRESRRSVTLPIQLMTGSGEMIPGVVLNISASGLLVLVDERSSPLVPPPPSSSLTGELFFEDVELPRFALEVVRITRKGKNQFHLGCRFVDVPPPTVSAIRATVLAALRLEATHSSR
jgi:hypothetical protein